MVGKKGRSGRPRKFNDSLHEYWRKQMRKHYNNNRELILFSMKHKLSRVDAREILKEQKRKETKK